MHHFSYRDGVLHAAQSGAGEAGDGRRVLVGEVLRRNLHRRHFVHDRRVEEHDAVVARLHDLEDGDKPTAAINISILVGS